MKILGLCCLVLSIAILAGCGDDGSLVIVSNNGAAGSGSSGLTIFASSGDGSTSGGGESGGSSVKSEDSDQFSNCCKICSDGIACGDDCIAASFNCRAALAGCACDE